MIRTAYLKKTEEKFRDLVAEVNRLRLRAEQEELPEIKAKYREQLSALDASMETVRVSLGKVREAAAAEWGASKAGVEKSLAELRKAIDSAIEKLRRSA